MFAERGDADSLCLMSRILTELQLAAYAAVTTAGDSMTCDTHQPSLLSPALSMQGVRAGNAFSLGGVSVQDSSLRRTRGLAVLEPTTMAASILLLKHGATRHMLYL